MVFSVNTPRINKLGTVGKPLANLEVRIADDGEIHEIGLRLVDEPLALDAGHRR